MRKIVTERPLTENGNGAQVYLEPEFVQQFGFPLDPTEECTAVLIPNKAVVLLPTDSDLPIDLTARSSEQYRVTTVDSDPDTDMTDTDTPDRGEEHGV